MREGEEVVLEGASFRDGELHLNSFSRVAVQGAARGKEGEFKGIAFEGADAIIELGTEKFRLPVEGALALFSVRFVPQGVGAATLLSIKSSALVGKRVHYFSEGGQLAGLQFEN